MTVTRPAETVADELPPRRRRGNVLVGGRLFHGWRIAAAGSLVFTMQGAFILHAFGTYAVVLREQFGWSKTTISLAYSFNRAESGLLGPFHGWLLQRIGPRRVMRYGAGFILVGFVWMSLMSSPVHFVLSFFTIAVGAGLCGHLTLITETVQWFERRRSQAIALVLMGLAFGGLVTPLVVLSINHLGWRPTAAVSGIVLGATCFALSPLYGRSPEEVGQPLDGIERDEPDPGGSADDTRVTTSGRDLTAHEALRTPAFWLLAFGHASGLLVVGSVIAHLSLFLTSEQGYSLQAASFVVAGIPIFHIAGMFVGGAIGDRVNKRFLAAVAMLGHVTALLLLTFALNSSMIWAFVVLHGLAWGVRGPLMSAIRVDYFGPSSFGQIMGYASVIVAIGMVGGPLFAGALADITGDYRLGFTILAGLSATGCVLFAMAKPPARTPVR